MAPTIRDLIPATGRVTNDEATPRVVGLDDDEADDVLKALGSATARTLYTSICEEPRSPTELVDEVGTSLQNVHHHLNRLEDAGLITPVGTTYSERGVEMTVFGSTDRPLVVTNANDSQRSVLREALKRLFVGIGGLLVLSFAVQRLSELIVPTNHPPPPPGMSASHAVSLPPGLIVFVVGLLFIAVIVIRWAVRTAQ